MYNLKKGYSFISVSADYQLQRSNGDLSNVDEAVVMRGKITDFPALVAGDVNVTLKSICYVVKVTAKVPSGHDIINVDLSAYKTSYFPALTFYGWTYANDEFGKFSESSFTTYCDVGLGTMFQSEGSKYGTGVSPDGSGNIVAYIIGYTGKTFTLPSGTVLTIKARSSSTYFEDIKILSSDIYLEPGKMYRINATLSEVTT